LELGADGVLIACCHPGDCHYVSGNEKAEERVKAVKKITELAGLKSERVRMEWISASEGKKFASVVQNFVDYLKTLGPNPIKLEKYYESKIIDIETLIKNTKAYYCLECGKCTSACQITKYYPGFSPRMIIEKALEELDKEIYSDKYLWQCTTCNLCGVKCPSEVQYVEFIKGARTKARKLGESGRCSKAGAMLSLMKIFACGGIKPNRSTWLENLKTSQKSEYLYFVGCLPYYEELYKDIGFDGKEIAKSVIGIFNKVGIVPAVMSEERCCGHDLLWQGETEEFEQLAKLNLEAVKKTNAHTVIFSCPECYRTFKKDYPEYVGELNFEVLHLSEFISALIRKGQLKIEKDDRRVTYQDPCRLGRHLGIYDAPRNILTTIFDDKFVEMERNKADSSCCGVSAWLNCDSNSKQIQLERIAEARATGADTLITACPKCQIHFRCAMYESETLEKIRKIEKIDVCDLAQVVFDRMR
ncbi:MAG: heterodisulfide reductase-related iron-sulfur binding cluster, partial [Candidatus Thermoplasmatota archaeon]|nr:heterodisulfide reductase-related iron-sulfur binding cluster [Candidatus Thermoplasmatota archaeon]